ncbi:ASCH/PUA domain-containing protein [Peribacillus sp. NPDC056705]|uniref:ASCH/PUA domain-containing protein n=1 Tax=Peribacillus sp. NPDC056705 TaxID=3345918 RepID=UPI00374A00B5
MNNQAKHELKILPEYFQAVWNGTKTFEVRKNDRNYAVGDTLVLKEWKPEDGYTGSGLVRKVSYMLDDSEYVKEGFVILGLAGPVLNQFSSKEEWEVIGNE